MLKKSRLLAVVASGLLVSACSGALAPSTSSVGSSGPLTAAQLKGKTLVLEGWGGAWTDATMKFADHWAQENGVTIQYPSAPNPGTALHLQVQSNAVQMDVADTVSYSNYKQGDLETFPDWLIATMKDTMPAECVTNYNIGCYGSTADVIGCNPDVISKCPTNAAQFWDTRNFPGPRAISGVDPPDATLLFALMAAGTPSDKLYPIDITKAIDKLKELKSDVRVWPASGGQMQQVLIDKEVGVEYGWNGRIFSVQQAQIPNLKVSWEDSSVSSGGGLAVAKGAPNKDVAFTFLNWWLQQPELQADWTSALTYPTPNKKVNELLAPNVLAAMPSAPNHPKPVLQDAEFAFTHQAEEQRAFQQFLTGS